MIDKLRPYPEYKDSGLPWLGQVPAHWQTKRAKWIFRYHKHLNASGEERNILSLTLRGVVNNNPASPEGLVPKDYRTYQIFEKGDLVFKLIDLENLRTSRVGLVHERGIMSPAYIRMTLTGAGDRRFFFYQYYDLYLRGIYNQLGSGVRATLGPNDLLNLPVCVPSLEEQSAIVCYLDSIDQRIHRFIRNRQRLIEVLNEQKQAIINRAVTRGLDPNVPFKPSGIDWLGDIPENWVVKPLKRWVAINKSVLTESTDPDYKFNYVDIGSVSTGALEKQPIEIRFGDAPSRARRILRTGDTIISTVRTYLRAQFYWYSISCYFRNAPWSASFGFAIISGRTDKHCR